MDPGDQSLSLDEFKSWKMENLRVFLTQRGMSKDGNKEDLAALCFAASRLGLPVIPTQEKVLDDNKTCYDNILKLASIPDPLELYDGWVDEKSGMSAWPPTFLSDITSFLLSKKDSAHVKEVMKDYKVGKAYEYFTSGWLQEVFMHHLEKTSISCILRAKCTPSQRLRDDSHDVWVCVNKQSGAINAAYCTCTAGLGQTCNHVAALLFRVEAANRYGLSSCTSTPCNWKTPSTLKKVEPSKLADLNIKKSSRSKKVKSRPLVDKSKREYHPVPVNNEECNNNKTVDSLAIALRGLLPNACLFKALPKEENNDEPFGTHRPLKTQTQSETHTQRPPATQTQSETQTQRPPATQTQSETQTQRPPATQTQSETQTQRPPETSVPLDHVDNFSIPFFVNLFKSQTSCYDFLTFLPSLSIESISVIEQGTVGQCENSHWFLLRKARLTASRFYNIYTKVNTIKKSATTVDCTSLIKLVMGYTKVNPYIKSLKYGRETEPIAIDAYLKLYRKKHSVVTSRKCGMFVDCTNIYLAATPDLLINCECCGNGLLEVKCPMVKECFSCLNFCCCANNLPECLINQNGKLYLKTNHPYYVQIQGQLFITKRNWCDLFIYTVNGNFELRIVLEKKFTDEVIPNLKYFYANYIVPELLTPTLESNVEMPEPMEIDSNLSHTFFCPICKNVIKETENISSYNQRSVECDICNLWYHFPCVKFKQSFAKKSWVCPKCSTVDFS